MAPINADALSLCQPLKSYKIFSRGREKSSAHYTNEGAKGAVAVENFVFYLTIINIIGFILFAVNTWLYSNTASGQIDKFLTITALAGGSLGILLSIFIFDRKAVKGNMMSRVFIACIFVIQIVLILFFSGERGQAITIAFWSFFADHIWLLAYLCIINIVTFIFFGLDKLFAIQRRSRIRIVTLLGLCFIGGSIGGLSAMYLFRHKTLTDYFTVGVPLIMVMQAVVVFYLMNL